MKTITIHLMDSAGKEIEAAAISALEGLQALDVKGLERLAAVKINEELKDVSTIIDSDATLQPVFLESEEGLEIMRHSTSHVMAEAVRELFPGVKVTIGPAIENGFYYDFDYERPFKEEDLPKIEEKMKEIINADLPFERREMTSREATSFFKNEGEDYKVEIIEDLGEERVSVYTQGSFTDLCRGPHLPSTGKIKAFRLTKVAKEGPYNRKLFLRINRGQYLINPQLALRVEGEWRRIYELLSPERLAGELRDPMHWFGQVWDSNADRQRAIGALRSLIKELSSGEGMKVLF